jgi:hypothetical protein
MVFGLKFEKDVKSKEISILNGIAYQLVKIEEIIRFLIGTSIFIVASK